MHAAEAEGRLTWLARHLQPRPPAQHTGAGLRPAEAAEERDNEWRRPGERRTCAFWAAEAGEEEARINLGGRKGFFSAVVAAYNNHWLLRTQPGDWWSVVRDKKTFPCQIISRYLHVRYLDAIILCLRLEISESEYLHTWNVIVYL